MFNTMFTMKLLIYLLISVINVCSGTASSPLEPSSLWCSPNLITPGTTFPRGDIDLPVGANLSIYCMLNETHPAALGRNSSNLFFINATKDSKERRISSEYVTVLNETTVLLQIPDVQRSASYFYCKLSDRNDEEKAVCYNQVLIDTKPQPVSNFSCVSHNWVNLYCSWKNPESFIKTKYKLSFRIAGAIGANRKQHFWCPKSTATNQSCLWDRTSTPNYKQVEEVYLFQIHGSNKLGVWESKEFNFSHFKFVIPSPPVHLRVIHKTAHSVTITWQPQIPMDIFPGGLIHKVEIQSMWDRNDVWKQVDTSMISKIASENYTLFIDNLDYANTHYEIRVYMKSARAEPGDELWSSSSNITFRTLPTEPTNPPQVDMGSFESKRKKIIGKRDVYIYWQQIPEYHYNGSDFDYVVTGNSNANVEVNPSEQTKTSAKFHNLEENMEYTFEIYSKNNMGRSSPSIIRVPKTQQVLPQPTSFTSIVYSNLTYELSWIRPKMINEISKVNYTLFWCATDQVYPFEECTGYLNWSHILGNSLAQNITVPDKKRYKFAISLNTNSVSSGMVWSQCLVIHNSSISGMNNVYIKSVGASSVIVAWLLECSDRVGVIKGFVVSYCPIFNTSDQCEENIQKQEIHDPSASELNVTGLHSYRTYKLMVAVLTTLGTGIDSVPIRTTTLTSAPSTPPILKPITMFSNTSVEFTWVKPNKTERNGMIVHYGICAYSNYTDVKCIQENEKEGIQQSATIRDLEPSTTYTLKIRAFTNAWSANSSGVQFTTKVGQPGRISDFSVDYVNETIARIIWKAPKNLHGSFKGYEIRIKYPRDEYQLVDKVCDLDSCSTDVILDKPLRCKDVRNKPSVQIRAYNQVEETRLFGEWSNHANLVCATVGWDISLSYIFLALGICLCFSSCMYYIITTVYDEYKKSKLLGVKLPPGLDIDTKDNTAHLTTQPWIPADYKDIKPPLPADEEYLIRPNRTPNQSESENDSERISLDSGDTHSSNCHQASTQGDANSTASTPPMSAYQAHGNIKSNTEKSAAALLSKISADHSENNKKPNEPNMSYVIIGPNNTIISNPPPPPEEDLYCPLELDDNSLPSHYLPHSLVNDRVLYPAEQETFSEYGETCLSMYPQPSCSLGLAESSRVPSMKNLVISTKPNTSQSGTTTTTTCTSGYQPMPLSVSSRPFEQKVLAPSVPSAIVINKGSNGYVTVSTAAVEPHNHNCV
uniref:Cytokine receptor n=1 Tax=Cacopsylla melanoneura TaxID=428564 RepID=A0A8D8TE23_9HEMI